MANTKTPIKGGGWYVNLDTTGTIEVGDAMGSSRIGSFQFQVLFGGADPGSLSFKTRLHGDLPIELNFLDTIYYVDQTTTVQSAGDAVSAAERSGTIVCDRRELQLDYTAGADGMGVILLPVMG